MSELFDSQKLVTIAENQQKVYNAGYEKGKTESGDSRYDTFWDVYQDNGNRTNYQYAFGGHGWRQATFQPKYPLTNISNAQSMFAYARIQRLEVPLDLTNAKQTTSIFNNAIILEYIESITFNEINESYSSIFASCSQLRTINEINGIIGKSISFNFCPLDKDSILNIYRALSTQTTTKQTITFQKSAIEAAFGSTTAVEWQTLTDAKREWWTFAYA